VLKKAGIVVAVAADGLLAVSPLAFAGDKGDQGNGHHAAEKNVNNVEGDETTGLINVTDNNATVPVAVCGNDVNGNVLGVQVTDVTADLTGALGLLGDAEAEDSGDTGDNRNCAVEGEAGDSVLQSIED
jgi:hypothetical protein